MNGVHSFFCNQFKIDDGIESERTSHVDDLSHGEQLMKKLVCSLFLYLTPDVS